jgi:hypothetical protein
MPSPDPPAAAAIAGSPKLQPDRARLEALIGQQAAVDGI